MINLEMNSCIWCLLFTVQNLIPHEIRYIIQYVANLSRRRCSDASDTFAEFVDSKLCKARLDNETLTLHWDSVVYWMIRHRVYFVRGGRFRNCRATSRLSFLWQWINKKYPTILDLPSLSEGLLGHAYRLHESSPALLWPSTLSWHLYTGCLRSDRSLEDGLLSNWGCLAKSVPICSDWEA